jgi:FkbM family methyltransferase
MVNSKIFGVLNLIERQCARYQGKGFGASSIKQEVNLVRKFINHHPKVAIDIGGNIGEYSAELKKFYPELNLHIFEPAKVNVVKLKERFKKTSSISIVPVGISDVSVKTKLYSDNLGSGLASLSKRKLDHFNINFDLEEEILTIRFEDYWLENFEGQKIDLIKIDIEGYELKALQGFGRSLKFINLIQFEFGGCNIDSGTYFRDFYYFFKENNFSIHRITPLGIQKIDRYSEQDEYFTTTNYLAKNLD